MSIAWIGFGAAIVAPTAAAIVTGIVSSRNLGKQFTEARAHQVQDRRLELYSDMLAYLWERRNERDAIDAASDEDLAKLAQAATLTPPASLHGRVNALAERNVRAAFARALDSHQKYLHTKLSLSVQLSTRHSDRDVRDNRRDRIDRLIDTGVDRLRKANQDDDLVAFVIQELLADPGLETRFDKPPSMWSRIDMGLYRAQRRLRTRLASRGRAEDGGSHEQAEHF